MNEHTLAAIKVVMDVAGDSAHQVVAEYKIWFIFSGLMWSILGAAVIDLARRWNPRQRLAETDDTVIFVLNILRWFVVFVGAVMIAGNLPDVFAPEAAAIHQLLLDAVPK